MISDENVLIILQIVVFFTLNLWIFIDGNKIGIEFDWP